MFVRGTKTVFLAIAGLFLGAGFAFAEIAIPAPVGHVNDLAEILSPTYREVLETSLRGYEESTGNEIAVLTVTSLEGGSIEDFAVRVFEQWGIGKEKEDNGLLLLVAKEDRKMRIEVGYGLEPYITDARAGRIIRDDIAPYFTEEKYDEGVAAAVARIKEHLAGAPATPDEEEFDWRLAGDTTAWVLTTGFFLLQFIFGGLLHLMARSKSILLGGGLGAVLGFVIGLFLGLTSLIVVPIVAFGLLGLLFDWLVSNYASERIKKGGSDIFWYGGGGFGGGSSGGFGGFGGGSSGGGGASGGW